MHILAIILTAIAFGFVWTLVAQVDTYKDFTHAKELPNGKVCTVVGTLDKTGNMVYNPQIDANKFSFYMKDKQGTRMQVVYKGAKPTDFERSQEITIKGKVIEDQFVAHNLLMKCPSKYTEDEFTTASSL